MVEFNADGSIKIPDKFMKAKEENNLKLINQRCIKVRKEVVNFSAPKKCTLHITLSNKFTDDQFVDNIYNFFKQNASTPTKIKKIDNKHFEVEIGTNFKRCSDCTSLINKYREFLDGNLIEEKGNCTYEGRKRSFSYEDHFD
jgi:hypothetical protein